MAFGFEYVLSTRLRRLLLAGPLLLLTGYFLTGLKSNSSIKTKEKQPNATRVAISYDRTSPPTAGCEEIVSDLQRQLVEAYQVQLKGIRYANIFGYLETENKGDAAIWSAQQIMLSTMGITTMEVCRFLDKDCNIENFKAKLDEHQPYSAILMAGGGNFNDYYHEDHPARLKMIEKFKDYRIRAFPQSIYMTKEPNIKQTADVSAAAKDLHFCARDKPSFDWLKKEFGEKAEHVKPNKVKHIMTPDIVFMFGNRTDFRLNTKKTHNIYILARDDMEISEGDSRSLPFGEGTLDLGKGAGIVTYLKRDWKKIKTVGINDEEITSADGTKSKVPLERGKDQRAWAKAMQGFELLASADLVITDRLHGHIMSTIIGVPHILMDSKLKKNLNYHDTWTKECGCTRVAESFDDAKEFARMFFEKQKHDRAKG